MTCIDDGKDGAMHGEYARNEPGVRKGAPEIKKAVGRTGIIVCFAARWREDAMRDAMQVAASREPPEDEHPSRPPSHPTGPVFPLPNSPSPGGPLSRAVIWTDDEWRPMKGGPGEADIPPGGHPQRNSLHLLNPCDATYMHTSQPIPSHLVRMSAEQTLPRTSTETRRSTSTFPPGSPRSAIPLPSPPPIPSCLQFHAIRCVTPPSQPPLSSPLVRAAFSAAGTGRPRRDVQGTVAPEVSFRRVSAGGVVTRRRDFLRTG